MTGDWLYLGMMSKNAYSEPNSFVLGAFGPKSVVLNFRELEMLDCYSAKEKSGVMRGVFSNGVYWYAMNICRQPLSLGFSSNSSLNVYSDYGYLDSAYSSKCETSLNFAFQDNKFNTGYSGL